MVTCTFCGLVSSTATRFCQHCAKPVLLNKPLDSKGIRFVPSELVSRLSRNPWMWGTVALSLACLIFVSPLFFKSLSLSSKNVFTPKVSMIVSSDAKVYIKVPSDWETDPGILATNIIAVSNQSQQMYIAIGSLEKRYSEINQVESLYHKSRRVLEQELSLPLTSEPFSCQVNGLSAQQYRIRGVRKRDNVDSTYLYFILETANYYYRVIAWTPTNRFQENQYMLDQIIQTFKEVNRKTVTPEEGKTIFTKVDRMLTVQYSSGDNCEKSIINFVSHQDPFEVQLSDGAEKIHYGSFPRVWRDEKEYTFRIRGCGIYQSIYVNGIRVRLSSDTGRVETFAGPNINPSQRKADEAGHCTGPSWSLPPPGGTLIIDVAEFTNYFVANCW